MINVPRPAQDLDSYLQMLPGNLLEHHGKQQGFRVANHQSSPEEPWLWSASRLSERKELNGDGVGKGLGVHQEAKQPQKHRPRGLLVPLSALHLPLLTKPSMKQE